MGRHTTLVATFSTLIGISVVSATPAWSSFFTSPSRPGPEAPANATLARVDRILDTEHGPVMLLAVSPKERLPILIGPGQALAIERGRRGAALPRPMTHDLMAGVVTALDGALHHVFVHDLTEDGTFLAEAVLDGPKGAVRVDARPSDAIALAVRTGAPVFVSEDLAPHMLRVAH